MTDTNLPSIGRVEFSKQINEDQKRYSRYVCDSRAIPNEIDGLKPVQRRILWTMWNSVAKNTFTKTVKVAGLVMGYHPHGDASIQDAISAMTQDFTFANNYPLLEGEGTFGDVLDPKAIASPRYTEVRLHQFSKDLGLFESLADVDYFPNYDETSKEPVFMVPKIPSVLLNPISGIATGFRCNMSGHKLGNICDMTIKHLKKEAMTEIEPWYQGYLEKGEYSQKENGGFTYSTHFVLKKRDDKWFILNAPQGMNREKTMDYLDTILNDHSDILRNYTDRSSDTYQIELHARKGVQLTANKLKKIFSKVSNEPEVYNVITSEGRLVQTRPLEIIERFCAYRKIHLKRRFERLAGLEGEKIERLSELIRFIKEKWNEKVTKIKSKKDFETQLKKAKYKYFEWLSNIPVYRMTMEEVKKCEEAINEAKSQFKYFTDLYKKDKVLTDHMIQEIDDLKSKWDVK